MRDLLITVFPSRDLHIYQYLLAANVPASLHATNPLIQHLGAVYSQLTKRLSPPLSRRRRRPLYLKLFTMNSHAVVLFIIWTNKECKYLALRYKAEYLALYLNLYQLVVKLLLWILISLEPEGFSWGLMWCVNFVYRIQTFQEPTLRCGLKLEAVVLSYECT